MVVPGSRSKIPKSGMSDLVEGDDKVKEVKGGCVISDICDRGIRSQDAKISFVDQHQRTAEVFTDDLNIR